MRAVLCVIFCLLMLAACTKGKTLTKDQCADMLDSMDEIFGGDGSDVTDEMISECSKNANFYKVYDCVMDASTKADLSRCGLAGNGM